MSRASYFRQDKSDKNGSTPEVGSMSSHCENCQGFYENNRHEQMKRVFDTVNSSMGNIERSLENQAQDGRKELKRLKKSIKELKDLSLGQINSDMEAFCKQNINFTVGGNDSSTILNCHCKEAPANLPRCNPKFKYDGNPRTYHDFIQTHKMIVNCGNYYNWQKLDILLDSCTGEALDLISRCYMSGPKGYEAALEILERIAGSKVSRQVSLYVELVEMPPVNRENLKTLTNLRNLTNHAFTMHKIYDDPPIDSLVRFKGLLTQKKFDENLKEEWKNFRKDDDSPEKLKFERLVEFLFIAVEKSKKVLDKKSTDI